jgi:NADH-ubiquinone oxidoreductase chain 5
MLLMIVFLPLIGFCVPQCLGQILGGKGTSYFSTIILFITFFLSCCGFISVIFLEGPAHVILCKWVYLSVLNVNWGFFFDALTMSMLIVITSISSLVHLYSTSYMREDPHLPRFLSFLSLFTFFMILLVTADNFLQMFVGWEGVGLSSYLLINFWFTRIQANKAAIKAMLVNRVGDFGLALGFILIFVIFQSLDYNIVFASVFYFTNYNFFFLGFSINYIELISFLLFIGVLGKSAQMGLHTWLPDAMEGPTPVSALIHAATMVTAGVFLLARCSPIFELAPCTLIVITFFGSCTAFFAASTGLLQNDLKKVIAYSTCSQLGYMVMACGLSSYSVGIFHLANHAFFKALLFLSGGSVIHALGDEQDMRKMGGLKILLPFTYSMFLIGSLALMGFPFLSGFYSKDVILEVAFAKYSSVGLFAYILGTLSAFLTAFYSIRLLYLTFLSESNGHKKIIQNVHEASYAMTIPLFILSCGSIFIGYLTKDMLIGLGSSYWKNAIYTQPYQLLVIDAEFIPTFYRVLPTIVALLGALSAFIFYNFYKKFLVNLKFSKYGRSVYIFLNRKWFFDKVFIDLIAQNILVCSFKLTYTIIDRGVLEIFGPLGASTIIKRFFIWLNLVQSGFIFHYSYLMFWNIAFSISILVIFGFSSQVLPNIYFYMVFLSFFLV